MAKKQQKMTITPGVIAIGVGFLLAASLAIWTVYQAKNDKSYDREAAATAIIAQLKEASDTQPSDELEAYIKTLDKEAGCDNGTHQLRIVYKDYAKVAYGCGNTDAMMFLTKTSGKWQTISPTNQFVADFPRCDYVKRHNIPAALYAEGCYESNDSMTSPVAGKIMLPDYE